MAAQYAPQFFLNTLLDITIYSAKAIGFLLGVPVTSNSDIMTVNGFAMRIITQCTALHYMIILSAAILLYTGHSLRYRITGLIVSILLVIVANAFRLIFIGVVGSISWDAFVIVHDYLWVAAFSLLILGIWIVWAERRFVVTGATVKHLFIVLLTCTAVYGILLLAMPLYGRFMALITSPVFKTFISDPQAHILFTGERMSYKHSGGKFSANFAMDLMAISLYLGLTLSAGYYGKETIKQGLLGFVIILGISAAAIAGGGVLSVICGENAALVFLWTSHGLLLQLTLLWWILRKPRERTLSEVGLAAVPD